MNKITLFSLEKKLNKTFPKILNKHNVKTSYYNFDFDFGFKIKKLDNIMIFLNLKLHKID